MTSCVSYIFLFVLSFLSIFRASAQDLSLLRSACPNTSTYSRNSSYYNNLNTHMSLLSSRNASYTTGFQNATVGQDPDRVNGLFLCRGGGDVSPDECRNCVVSSVNESLTRCPNQREAVLYYEECMLRYSHRNILSTLRTDGGYTLPSTNDIPPNQQAWFRELVLSVMNQAATEAAASSRKWGATIANFTAFESVYGLVQCTPDMTAQDCSVCLETSINQLPREPVGARVLLPSCNSRYELYPFYDVSVASTLPSSLPPPGKDGNSSVLVVAIVVPILVVVLLFIAGYCFLAKRAKRNYETAPSFNGHDITTIDSLQLDYKTIQAATSYCWNSFLTKWCGPIFRWIFRWRRLSK